MTNYDLSIALFTRALTALSAILEKGKAHADSKKVDFSVFLASRLAPDQFPLSKQLQIATDIAKLFVPRIIGIDAPKFADTETTYDEFQDRIQTTLKFLATIPKNALDSLPEKKIEFPWNPGKFLNSEDYLLQYAIPNVYFHITTAYAILRANGVQLGKADFLGNVNWQNS